MTGRFSAAAPIAVRSIGGMKAVNRRPGIEVEEELEVVVDELPQRLQLARHRDVNSTERFFGSTLAPTRSICSADGTSVSQS